MTPNFGPLWYVTGVRDTNGLRLEGMAHRAKADVPSVYLLLSFYLGTGKALISACWVLPLVASSKTLARPAELD